MMLYAACSSYIPSNVSSFLPFLKKQHKKKTAGKSYKKVFWTKTSAWMEPSKTNQTRWEWHHSNFTPSLHLVPFCQLCTPQTRCMHLAYSHPLNEHCAQHCSFHSLLHKRQCISAMFSSNKISHKLLQHTIQTKLMHSTVSTIKTDYTCHAHYSSYIEAIHNVTHSPCTSTCTPHPTPLIPHCLHNYAHN